VPNKKLLAAFAAGMMLSSAAAKAESLSVWTGADVAPNSYFAYLGGVAALSGQAIEREDGFLFRFGGGYGEYHYDTVAVSTGRVDANLTAGELMLGYSFFFANGSLGVYMGGNAERHDASPVDSGNSVRGTAGGLKGSADLKLTPMQNVSLGASGSYSSAFDSYWTHLDAGYDFGPFSFGPEATFLGNEGFNQSRFGAAISNVDIGFAMLRLYGGYAENRSRGADGFYAGFGLGADF
jgi:hypothetical protein